ncbi:MAG TPA: EAL domain-containing protein [Gammaproteobacteria bacterium]|nr:EAL domain-containing protein [Gammaproteobacteria bacterium]
MNSLRAIATYLREHPLGLRVLAFILLISSLFALFATAVQLYVDYRKDVGGIERRINEIELSYLASITYSLWALDYAQLETQMQGILQLPDIKYVEIVDEAGRYHHVGKLPEENIIRSAPRALVYEPEPGKRHVLGTLSIVADLSGVYARLWDRLLVILATQAVKTFGVSIFILLVFHYLVTRHLGTLASYARRLRLDRLDEAPVLDRPPRDGRRPDELDDVVHALDEMRQTLAEDIRRRERAELELRKLSQAVEQSPEAIMITDARGVIEYVNPRFVELTGFVPGDVIGVPSFGNQLGLLTVPANDQGEILDLREAVLTQGEWRGELRTRKKNGTLYWQYASLRPIRDASGAITHFLAVMEDITVLKEYEERLLHQANYDQLTGLPNRLLAFDRLAQTIATAQREHHRAALLYVDLDNFKRINESYGHLVGDALLVQTAARLRQVVGEECTVARFGGDEFLVIAPTAGPAHPVEYLAQHILQAFSRPFELTGHVVYTTVTIGIAVYPDDGDNAQTILRNADAALFAAKEAGRNTYRFFTSAMNDKAAARLRIESALRSALTRGEFELHYHPIIDVRSGRTAGVEALIRWQNPHLGVINTQEFIKVAEESGQIVAIGEWVLMTACQQAAQWQSQGFPLRVGVNVSHRQFRDGDIVAAVSRALQEAGLPPHALELEVTEALLLDESPVVTAALNRLDLMGVRLVLDDFGTGYSAIGLLKRISFDAVKIESGFIHGATENRADAALVDAIVHMAHSLGLEVIAEGVETEHQFGLLRELGCDFAQGLYFSQPLPVQAGIAALMRSAGAS